MRLLPREPRERCVRDKQRRPSSYSGSSAALRAGWTVVKESKKVREEKDVARPSLP